MAEQTRREFGRFSREFIDQLTQRIDGPAFLGRFMKIESRGDRHFGVCPFHQDSKPSCLVRPNGSFYCFGCQKNGSVFNFLMEKNGQTFTEAVAEVAQFMGVPLPERKGGGGPSKEQLAMYDLLEDCTAFFEGQLKQAPPRSPVKRYLQERQVDLASVGKYRIGFAQDAWDSLKKRFGSTEESLLVEADVLVKNEEKGRVYDRYRNRMMFPIRNRQGYVVGFGGRALDDTEPKYLNTKQTKVFSKARELYGLYEALELTRRPQRLVLVEGYMDVVALSQHDIPYAVAALGTASNENHFRTMFWFTNEVICCFDGDDAGRTAAKRALEAALGSLTEDKTVRFMFIPDGEDPDTFVRKQGKEAFEAQLDASQHVADYFVENILEYKDRSFKSLEQKARFIDRAVELIQRVKQESMRKILVQEVSRCFPDEVNMEQLLATQGVDAATAPPPMDDAEYQELDQREFVEHKPKDFYTEINTRRRVSHLLCAPNMWRRLKEHHELLERLVNVAPDEPLTQVWLAIDKFQFTEPAGLIASFQDDEWFATYLADIYDERIESALADSDDTLERFLDGVDTFLTTSETQVEAQTRISQLLESNS